MREIVKGVVKTGKFMFIGDEVYVREATDRVKVKAYDLGAGQMEIIGQRVYEYRPVDELDFGHAPHPDYFINDKEPTAAELAEREERNRERAAKRARANVRRLSKVMGANALMTLTYRANQTDLALCKKHLKEFVRRLYRVIPDFQGIAAFERQKRGAWHVHIAVKRVQTAVMHRGVRVKSFDLLRAVWRSVTGELQGTVNMRNSYRGGQRSAAQIASYISKYISKAFEEGEAFVNRWTKFGDCKVPKAMDFGQCGSEIVGFELAFDLMDSDHVVRNMCRSHFGDFFFIVVEKKEPSTIH